MAKVIGSRQGTPSSAERERSGRRERAEALAAELLRKWEKRSFLTDFDRRDELKEAIARAIMEQDCHTRYACAAAALQMVRSHLGDCTISTAVHEAVLQTKEGL